ncbi:methylenetetrahydrofolate--tRNA-(uracil(54)-C(5))-methyltransferase (FADH(2)-oxidizing) TrmFO [Desulfovibrio inopinatus]|uniref:methylenetetrahydrofolate--tRNA-(uracil(54)- C(5))-methyltransferase (FADH(2)-oxidizing) TrmFO n=1 Tax=Desulfovibrio inopinatus TaxID=102109 RepID=UPI000405E96A|nr:methylenetetrahydrofolate--tRNA-(uracil(54)-C(5))-methyltransferase (FADH(2)-oxidizing) TrmFO [Desulfovibrio inopinatus]
MQIAIIGGGLAGCECAYALAEQGIATVLFEMKPESFSPAHTSEGLAELVCSNSLRSDDHASAVGLLKQEMTELGSLIMRAARETAVPAGKALAVDRSAFSAWITQIIEDHPLVTLKRQHIHGLDDPALADFDIVVVAAGPLASDDVAQSLATIIGGNSLYFYDAIAPIIAAESINMDIAFWASRYEDGPGDYLNCPMSAEEYKRFYDALMEAEKVAPREFEKEIHFEGCMPVEALAERGEKTLTFGPLKPVGLVDPRTGRRSHAVVQLRPENLARTALNMVGFQTKLKYGEQERVFRLIPGLEHAEFERLGSIHRNTYVNAPQVLAPDLSLRNAPHIFLAGQITGVEGYVESAACGLWLGLLLAGKAKGRDLPLPPDESALGALLRHLRTPVKKFQPSNVMFGLFPELEGRFKKADRKKRYGERARTVFAEWKHKTI